MYAAAAFLLLSSLTIEQRQTFLLASARHVTIEHGGDRVILEKPACLHHFRIVNIMRGASSGEPASRIWFDGRGPFAVWPSDSLWDLEWEDAGWTMIVAVPFLSELNKEFQAQVGKNGDIRKRVQKEGVP